MTRYKRINIFITALITLLSCGNQNASAQSEISFSFEEYKTGNIRLPYRQAIISESEPPSRLVIYLHGGTSKGNDNISQLNEPAIDSIASFISKKGLNSTFIVPQCPENDSWGGRLTDVLKELIANRKDHFTTIKDVYIFGGSMGGTGTWTMISKFPQLFSAAMPVAGNPSKCDMNNVSQTPLFTVMGTNDRIMNIETVNDLVSESDLLGAKYVYETEEGWTHEDVCIKSYTKNRLNWVFSNSKQSEGTGIENTEKEKRILQDTQYCTLSGLPIQNPSNGLCIMRQIYSDKTVKVSKQYFR